MFLQKKDIYVSILLTFIVALFLESCCGGKEVVEPPKLVSLGYVFGQIKNQFERARDSINVLGKTIYDRTSHDSGSKTIDSLVLKEADVTFDNIVSSGAEGSLSILVFKPQYTYTRKKETTVTFSLINNDLPKPVTSKFEFGVEGKNKTVDDTTLAKLIQDAATQFSRVKFDLGDTSKLERDFEIDIAFSIDQSGGLQITGPIGSFTPEIDVTRDVQNSNTIALKFLLSKRSNPKYKS